MTIKRYYMGVLVGSPADSIDGTPPVCVREHEDLIGGWCRWSDVEPIIAERDALAQFAENRRVQINELMDENEKLKDEVFILQEEIKDLKA